MKVYAGMLSIVLPMFLPCGARGQEQDAVVTFYSHGNIWTSGWPGSSHDVYIGGIFDGKQGLFWFRDHFFAHNNRYLTLRLAPGAHTFGASNGKRPEGRESLDVVLEPGKSYFIRAQGETAGVPGVFTIQHGRLDLMNCSEAHTEMEKAKMLGEKALSKYTRAKKATMVVDETGPPPCN